MEQDLPGLINVERILEEMGTDLSRGTLGGELMDAILSLMDDCRRDGQKLTGRLLGQVFRGDVVVVQESLNDSEPLHLMDQRFRERVSA